MFLARYSYLFFTKYRCQDCILNQTQFLRTGYKPTPNMLNFELQINYPSSVDMFYFELSVCVQISLCNWGI